MVSQGPQDDRVFHISKALGEEGANWELTTGYGKNCHCDLSKSGFNEAYYSEFIKQCEKKEKEIRQIFWTLFCSWEQRTRQCLEREGHKKLKNMNSWHLHIVLNYKATVLNRKDIFYLSVST